MLFLGVLSVLQLTLFPGLLIIRLFPAKRSIIQQFAYIFMLSLLANYLAVFVLVALGIYLRSVVLVLFILEMVLLIWLNRDNLRFKLGGWSARISKSISTSLAFYSEWIKKDFWAAFLYALFGLIAIVGITWVLLVWINNFNTVYQTWDAWASWDRWAEKWAENRFPDDTWEYPQLIPASYSLAYKFIGTVAVKFFGKSIMPLFTLFIGLVLFDLGRKYRSYGYMLGAGVAIYTINLLLGKYIADAYVDIPVACFSLITIYTLLKAEGISNWDELKQTLLLGSLATAAAAVTKQTGLYLMFFYPILAYLWIFRSNKRIKRRLAFSLLAKHFLLVLALVIPWYIFVEYRIIYGDTSSVIQYVINDIYEGQTYWERFLAALRLLDEYAYLYIFLLVSLFALNNKFRQIVVFLILPFSILWALFLGYEPRNLAIAITLVAMSTGVAVESWGARLKVAFKNRNRFRLPAYAVVLVLLAAVGLGTLALGDEPLIEKQISEQRQIFEPELNEKLYSYFSREHGPRPVITDYPLDWLPGLKGFWRFESFTDYDIYEQNLLKFSDADLLLVRTEGIDPRIAQEIQDRINSGVYELIFTESGYMLVRILPR